MTKTTPGITWRWVPGYEGLYKASSGGDVMRVAGLDAAGRYRNARVLRGASNATGYQIVSLCKGGVYKTCRVHVLVMRVFVGPRPTNLAINHKDGNKKNNAATNLEYVTRAENEAHALCLGLKPSHERHGQAKLTYGQVAEIRRRAANRDTYTSIAEEFPVHRTTISKIARGVIWGGIE